jgi:hypothetical protein
MNNLKQTGGIFISILSQESTFHHFENIYRLGFMHFNQNLWSQKSKYRFQKQKSQKLCFDRNSSPQIHQLLNYLGYKCVTKKSREE